MTSRSITFTQVVDEVLSLDISPASRVIYLALYREISQGREPTQADIARLLHISYKSILIQLVTLEHAGLIRIHRRGQGKSSLYYLLHLPSTRTTAAKRLRPIRELYRKDGIPRDLRWQVWLRDNFSCRTCGNSIDLAADHVIPESKGGTTTLDNLQTLCRPCNRAKGTSSG